MPIEFSCPKCNTTLRVPDEHAGKQARCPTCQAVVEVEAVNEPMLEPDFGAPQASMQPPMKDFTQPMATPNPYASTSAGPRPHLVAHRGGMVLTMGILALLCNLFAVPGIIAWVMGRSDLKQMDAGYMDPEGRGLTQAGMILGIIGTSFVILGIVIWVIYIVFIFVLLAGAAAGAAGLIY